MVHEHTSIPSLYKKYQYYYEINKGDNYQKYYVIDNENHLRYLKHLYKSDDVGFVFIDNVWLMIPGYKNKMRKNDYNVQELVGPVDGEEKEIYYYHERSAINTISKVLAGVNQTKEPPPPPPL